MLIDAVVDTTMKLPFIDGAKKLIYTGISLPLTKIADFEQLSKTDNENAQLFKELAIICEKYDGIWNEEAEKFLLNNAKKLEA